MGRSVDYSRLSNEELESRKKELKINVKKGFNYNRNQMIIERIQEELDSRKEVEKDAKKQLKKEEKLKRKEGL